MGPQPQRRDEALPNPSRPHRAQAALGASGRECGARRRCRLLQRLLPLVDGNSGTAVANLLAQRQRLRPRVRVDLAPIEDSLAEIQTQHRALRDQVTEQNTSLKRVEDQLEMVREATDRNTLEQQELLEDLKTVGSKVNLVALIAIGLAFGFFQL